ncbi:MAG: carboxymuconolactone decarboxylase family protein, partial [Cypionkella sp.]
MSYKSKTAEMRGELRALNKLLPETNAGFAQLSKAAKEEGAISVKEREYVALAIAVTQRCGPCINFHIEAMLRAGAIITASGGRIPCRIDTVCVHGD